MTETPEQLNDQPGLFIGIDWADEKHDCYAINRDGKGFHQEISHSPEDIDIWIGEMLKLADGKPIAIMLEQSRGPLVYCRSLVWPSTSLVQRRYACPKYLRQTFHEFADSARKYCPWTKARYRMLRDRGMKHHATLRKIARSWIRILFRVWQTGVPFDCDRYIVQLKKRCPEITPYLEQQK